ncbi:MAG: tRNA 2-thiocytidine(32) synthetase TtcA [Chromatiales bacterium]|nr:tRNA 2-thiocytidine(32) synthetase TtcA [Chromatiales bacterium]
MSALPVTEARRSANVKRLEARLRGLVGKTIERHRMIEPGDRVMVCVSGGKDSFTLLDLMAGLRRSAPIDFEIVAVHLDQKQPGFPVDRLADYLERTGIPWQVVEQDTYSVVKRVIPEGKTMCGLCSRLRRGVLYRHAAEQGFDKIALGHHRNDAVETLFLNLFHGGRIAAMPPKLRSEDGRHIVIRPLADCDEADIARFARARGYPVIPCNLCGSQDGLQRQQIKAMLAEWERTAPGRMDVLHRALAHVRPSHLADTTLFDFAGLRADAHETAAASRGGMGVEDLDGVP